MYRGIILSGLLHVVILLFAVVGLPDDTWGDRVHAVISGRPGLDADAVLAEARDRLAGFKRPRSIEVWDELPKSAANKILRREVRDRILARDEDQSPDPAAGHGNDGRTQ